MRGNQTGSLFKFRDGRPLTRQRFVMAVKEALDAAGVEAGQYLGHSFHIGAATTAALQPGAWRTPQFELWAGEESGIPGVH